MHSKKFNLLAYLIMLSQVIAAIPLYVVQDRSKNEFGLSDDAPLWIDILIAVTLSLFIFSPLMIMAQTKIKECF